MKKPSKIEMVWSFTGPFTQPSYQEGARYDVFDFSFTRDSTGHHSPHWILTFTIFNFRLFELEYYNRHHLDCEDDCHKL